MNRKVALTLLSVLLLFSSFSGSFFVFAEEIAYEEKKTGYVNSDTCHVREGAGTSYAALKLDGSYVYLYKDHPVNVIAEDKDTNGDVWYKIEFSYKDKEYTQWIYGEYVTIQETVNQPVAEENAEEADPPQQPAAEENPVAETPKREATVVDSGVRVRTGPGTNYPQLKINGVAQYYNFLEVLTVLGEAKDGNGDLWYKVQFVRNGTTYTEYIYAEYAEIKIEIEDDTDFEAYLTQQGFPESYKTKLRQLHSKHPNWKFVAYKVNYDWDYVINKESRLGYSLVQSSNLALRNVAAGSYNISTKQFKVFDGSNWYAANPQTVAFYMDPRNFLNEINVFMFLNLSFKEREDAAAVQKLLNGTFMKGTDSVSGKTYAQIFYEAGKKSKASPIYLAALAKQEQGNGGSRAITGESFTYNNKTYSNLYNFYNIGATSGTDNWKKGLIYANGGERGTTLKTSYNRPWNTVEKSIVGGALWIADGYINVGQDTIYFQKFNVTKYSTFGHQYMTALHAPQIHSSSSYATYKAAGFLDAELVFTIPVFNNMPVNCPLPTTYKLPTTAAEQTAMSQPYSSTPETAPVVVDPQPEPQEPQPEEPQEPQPEPQPEQPEQYGGDLFKDLKLTVNGGDISGFVVEQSYEDFLEKAKKSVANSVVVVKNNSGQVISKDKPLATGNTIEITDEAGTKKYNIIIKGDVNGDGVIDLVDLIMVKRDILGYKELSGNELKAALTNGDTEVNLVVYIQIKRHILGYATVPQE